MTPWLGCIRPDCRRAYEISDILYRCPACGDLLEIQYRGQVENVESWKETFRLRRSSNYFPDRSGVWRFREMLPFCSADEPHLVTMEEGNTPVLEAPRSARYCGLARLRIKHLGWNPTGSFKDYGMTVAVSQARKLGATSAACASTGNTSASMAAYCARAGMKAVVFIPEGQIAYGKLSQSLDYGARTIQILGDFDVAMALVEEVSRDLGLYLVNSINPFRLEGQKTILYELMDQLGWNPPDCIVVPGGNLGNSSSLGKALQEMKEWGFLQKVPRLLIVQAEGANPLYRTWSADRAQLEEVPHARTLATAIKIGRPVSWQKAIRALQFSGGDCQQVSETEIADAKSVLGQDGIGCEPASATTVAGLRKLRSHGGRGHHDFSLSPEEDVVAILTGHQLKDPDYTVRYYTDILYESSTQKVEWENCSAKINPAFLNRPVQVKADKREIARILGGC